MNPPAEGEPVQLRALIQPVCCYEFFPFSVHLMRMAAGVYGLTRGIKFSVGNTRILKVEDTQELDVMVLILRVSQVLLSNPRKEKWHWELFYLHFPFSSQYLFISMFFQSSSTVFKLRC